MNRLVLEIGCVCDPRRNEDREVRHVAVGCACGIGDDNAVIAGVGELDVGLDQVCANAAGQVEPAGTQLLPLTGQRLRAGGRNAESRGGAGDVGA